MLQIFTLNVLGHTVLSGIPRPDGSYEVLDFLTSAYQSRTSYTWAKVLNAVEKYTELHEWRSREGPHLPFPRWWEEDPMPAFNLSQWVSSHLAQEVSISRKLPSNGCTDDPCRLIRRYRISKRRWGHLCRRHR